MNKDKQPRSSAPFLLLILIIILYALLSESSPYYYKTIFEGKTEKGNSSTTSNFNTELRERMQNGGSITFNYNYIPSERSWDTMYNYCIYRYGTSGDCTFYCTRHTLDYGTEDLCNRYFSENIWNEILSMILDKSELHDITSVYDSNGMVVDTKIDKTISIGGGIYKPQNIGEIEAYLKKLAINAGVNASDLEYNVKIDDTRIIDKSRITDLHGSFVYNTQGNLSSEEINDLENYLWEKYRETGVRMYILLDNTDDNDFLEKLAKQKFNRATSPAMAFGLVTDTSWIFRYRIKQDQESGLNDNYSKVADAYFKNKKLSKYQRLIKAIDKAYSLY